MTLGTTGFLSRATALVLAAERDGAVFVTFFRDGAAARLTEDFFVRLGEVADLEDADFAGFRVDDLDPAALVALGRFDFDFNFGLLTDLGAERALDVRRVDLLKPLVTGLLISRSKLGGWRPCKATQNSSRSLT